jgi:hypothetical protein
MLLRDYVGVALALTVGVASMIWRRPIAERAIRQHRRLYGAQWDPRSFEVCLAAAGLLCILWAVFVVCGVWLWGSS